MLPREYQEHQIHADVIVVDPPRKGLEGGVIDTIAALQQCDTRQGSGNICSERISDTESTASRHVPPGGSRGDSSIDVKGQGLRGEKSLILSLSCTPDFFAKGWFNEEKTLWGNLSNELFYRGETRD